MACLVARKLSKLGRPFKARYIFLIAACHRRMHRSPEFKSQFLGTEVLNLLERFLAGFCASDNPSGPNCPPARLKLRLYQCQNVSLRGHKRGNPRKSKRKRE